MIEREQLHTHIIYAHVQEGARDLGLGTWHLELGTYRIAFSSHIKRRLQPEHNCGKINFLLCLRVAKAGQEAANNV